ncbi:MAG TPA: hypothetical protein VGL71_10145, partial [Urbifossiella sp.]
MPSERRQLNVRLDPESSQRFDRLYSEVQKSMGAELSQAQFIAIALKAFEERQVEESARKKSAK